MMGNPQPTVPVINSTPWSLNSQPNRVYIQHKIGKQVLFIFIKGGCGIYPQNLEMKMMFGVIHPASLLLGGCDGGGVG